MPYDYIEEYQKQNDDTIWEFRDKDAQSKIDISLTETDYANPLSLETMQAQTAKNTKIKIEPIQDLHGYDKPWVGGAGKNKLEITSITKISGGITFTVVKDDANNITKINIKGLSTAETYYHLNNQSLENGEYEISGGAEAGKYFIYVNGNNIGGGQTSLAVTLTNTRFTADNSLYTNYDVGIGVFNNVNLNAGYDLYPMIRLASESNTFAPYSNICPISGHDQINVLGCGKNLLPSTVDWIKTNNTNGTWNGLVFTHDSGVVYTILVDADNNVIGIKLNGTPLYTSYFSPGIFNFAANVSYLVNGGADGGSQQSYFAAINNGINLYDSSDGTQRFTTDTSAKYFVVAVANATITNKVFYPMIRLATVTDNTFEPYTLSNDLTISLGQTVYGGTLDVENGVLVVDKEYMTCNGTEDWVTSDSGRRVRCDNMLPDAKVITSFSAISDLVCNMYPTVSNNDTYNLIYGISLENKRVFISDGTGTMDATAFKSLLASNNLQLAYPLATPTTIQLTPNQISLLEGVNNISTDGDKITLTYRNGIFATLEELSDLDTNVKDILDKFNALGLSVVDGKLCQTYNT